MEINLRQAPALSGCSHWVFDMDGTLTVAAHDFDAIHRELGVPLGKPLLEAIKSLSPEEAVKTYQRLVEIEMDIAAKAVAQEGATDLLGHLRDCGRTIGILTRNSLMAAKETLANAGLDRYFDDEDIVGRDTCAPKPSPEGVLHLLKRWQTTAADAVVIGDYLYDLQAGRAAGADTVHLDVTGRFRWPYLADHAVIRLGQVLTLAGGL